MCALVAFCAFKILSFLHGSGAWRHLNIPFFFMAVTERDVQRVVDAMPVLEQRVAEIEKNASAVQIVNQATVQTMRNEFTESCNNVVDQASAKFANSELDLHETAKAIVDGAGQEFRSIKSTITVTMQDVESAVATRSQRVSALEAHPNKVVTQDPVTFQTHIKAIEQRLSTMEKRSTGSSSTTAPGGTLTRGHLPERNTLPRALDQWRARRDDVAVLLDTRNVGMFKFLHAIASNRDTLADSTMKRKWAALGEKKFWETTCNSERTYRSCAVCRAVGSRRRWF